MRRRADPWKIDALAKARELVRRRAPYFATGIYRLKPVKVEGLGSLAVDTSQRLYYDPVAIEERATKDVASDLVHELLHLLDRHAERAVVAGINTKEKAAVWNIAADLALFRPLHDGRWSATDHLRPSHFDLKDGLTVEAYYKLMLDLEDGVSPPPPGPNPGQGNCGSCATNQQSDWEQPAESASDVNREILRHVVARTMQMHDKVHGSIPASIREIMDMLLTPPKIPWQRVFSSMVRTHAYAPGKVDYSRSRPSRRQQSTPDVLRPSLVRPAPRVAVVVDTSGSMSTDDIGEALSEVKGILRATGVDGGVTVLPCDSAVHAVQQIWHPRQVQITGRGGTDMGVGLVEAAALVPAPSVVVVMTDGYTGWPKTKPTRCPAVVLLVGHNHASLTSVPTWARGLETDQC